MQKDPQNKKNEKPEKEIQNERYIIIKELGVGSFGKAYLVKRETNKQYAAIKTMILEGMKEEEKKEAYMEAKILKGLTHPNIVKFIEVFRQSKPKSTLNIVMEYAEGGDLFSKIRYQAQKRQYFSENVILDWFTQICLAIRYIHKKRILHRDLKSKNIFLSKNFLIKLGDFGIAKCLNCTMDIAKTMVGTPYYLSPEMVRNEPYSFKSDVWALGVLLYEMVALKMPFDAKSFPQLTVNIMKGEFSPIPEGFSKELNDLIKLLLNPVSSKRPSVDEILKQKIIQARISNFFSEMDIDQLPIQKKELESPKESIVNEKPQSKKNSSSQLTNIKEAIKELTENKQIKEHKDSNINKDDQQYVSISKKDSNSSVSEKIQQSNSTNHATQNSEKDDTNKKKKSMTPNTKEDKKINKIPEILKSIPTSLIEDKYKNNKSTDVSKNEKNNYRNSNPNDSNKNNVNLEILSSSKKKIQKTNSVEEKPKEHFFPIKSNSNVNKSSPFTPQLNPIYASAQVPSVPTVVLDQGPVKEIRSLNDFIKSNQFKQYKRSDYKKVLKRKEKSIDKEKKPIIIKASSIDRKMLLGNDKNISNQNIQYSINNVNITYYNNAPNQLESPKKEGVNPFDTEEYFKSKKPNQKNIVEEDQDVKDFKSTMKMLKEMAKINKGEPSSTESEEEKENEENEDKEDKEQEKDNEDYYFPHIDDPQNTHNYPNTLDVDSESLYLKSSKNKEDEKLLEKLEKDIKDVIGLKLYNEVYTIVYKNVNFLVRLQIFTTTLKSQS